MASVAPAVNVNARLLALDGLRFVAALAVVLYHYINRPEAGDFGMLGAITQFGYLGVPLFFMISGYVIAVSAAQRSPWAFLVARAVRLYPAYWCGLAFTVAVVALSTGKLPTVTQLLANLTLFNDVLGIANIDGVYWTLHAELRFYGCVFVLLVLGVFNHYRWWLTAWLLMTLVHLFTGQPFFMGWFISPIYSPFFIAGILFYLLQRGGYSVFVAMMLPASLLLALWRSFEVANSFIVDVTLLQRCISVAAVATFFALFYCIVGLQKNRQAMARTDLAKPSLWGRILPLMGLITYPLYLLHNVAGKEIIDTLMPFVGEATAITFTVAFMLLCSLILVTYLEPPLARGLKPLLQGRFFPVLFFAVNRRRANIQ